CIRNSREGLFEALNAAAFMIDRDPKRKALVAAFEREFLDRVDELGDLSRCFVIGREEDHATDSFFLQKRKRRFGSFQPVESGDEQLAEFFFRLSNGTVNWSGSHECASPLDRVYQFSARD